MVNPILASNPFSSGEFLLSITVQYLALTDSGVSWTTLDIPWPKNIFYNILGHLKIILRHNSYSFVKNVVNVIT